jgi:hypothetical protein
MKLFGQAALVILLASAFGPSGALCGALCSCNWERDPLKARDGAAVVVEGLALDSTLSAPAIRGVNGHQWFQVRVVVRNRWKGSVPDTIVVRTTEPAGGCGFSFHGGQRYLLFLYKDTSSGLSATMCSLSQPFSEAESVIRKLGPPLRKGAA